MPIKFISAYLPPNPESARGRFFPYFLNPKCFLSRTSQLLNAEALEATIRGAISIHLLERYGLGEQIFKRVGEHLHAGFELPSFGTIVDADLIAAPGQERLAVQRLGEGSVVVDAW